jgi:hypothetical protein
MDMIMSNTNLFEPKIIEGTTTVLLDNFAKIAVIGVGGGGCNMVNRQKRHFMVTFSLRRLLGNISEKSDKELDGVQNGSQAMNTFANMCTMEEEKKQKMRKALLEYCKLDTLAMVKILEQLRKVIYD